MNIFLPIHNTRTLNVIKSLVGSRNSYLFEISNSPKDRGRLP
jgi:hypothetical protein